MPALGRRVNLPFSGGVVERSIAPVLKTGEAQVSVGSNPTPSAIRRSRLEAFRWDENAVRAEDRSPEATNPTPSDFRRSRLEAFRWDESAALRHRPTRGRPHRGGGRGAGINFRSSSRRRVAGGGQSHLLGAADGKTTGFGDVAAPIDQGPIAWGLCPSAPWVGSGPPSRPRTFSGLRQGRSNRNAVKMAPRQRPNPTTRVEKQKDVGIKACSARLFTRRYIGFAEKWHGDLVRDDGTSSAGCRCHVVQIPMDETRRRQDWYRTPFSGQCFLARGGGGVGSCRPGAFGG